MLLSIFTLRSDRTPTADAILKTTSLARRYGISSFATHGPLSATVFMVLYLKKKRDCTIRVAKTKALISFAVTAKLICVFVFAYADCWFSHEAAQILMFEISSKWFMFVYMLVCTCILFAPKHA